MSEVVKEEGAVATAAAVAETPVSTAVPAVQAETAAPSAAPTVEVMEIDETAPKEQQDRDLLEASVMGLPIFLKGKDGKVRPFGSDEPKPAAAPTEQPAATAAVTKTQEANPGGVTNDKPGEDGAHPLSRFYRGEEAAPEPISDAVKEYFTKQGFTEPENVVSGYRTVQADFAKLQEEHNSLKRDTEYLGKLSQEAMNVIQMDLEGQDWKQVVLGRPNLDFSKPFEKQDPKVLVSKYPSKVPITNEDWAEFDSESGDPAVKAKISAVLETVEGKYAADQRASQDHIKSRHELLAANTKKYNDSLGATIADMNRVPGAATHVDKIKGELTPEGVLSVFFEADGVSLKPDAARNLWLLKDAPAILGAQKVRVETKAKEDATLEHIRRTPEHIASRQTARAAVATGTPQQQVEAYMKSLGI